MASMQSYNGIFFPRDSSDAGHLIIAGKDSVLQLISKGVWNNSTDEFHDLYGTLANGKKASLLGCIRKSLTQHRRGEGAQYESSFFPHYVVLGETFINSTDAVIRAVHYHFENADCLVNGHRTFHSIHPEPDEVRKMLEADHLRREEVAKKHGWGESAFEPEIGEYPELLYFSGVWEIVKCHAGLGTVTLNNRTSHGMGGSKGIGIKNQIGVSLEFSSSKTLREAVNALGTLHTLFELTLGSRQRFLWIELELTNSELDVDGGAGQSFKLFWSYCNNRVEGETKPTSYIDILIDPERRPEEFANVVSGWLNSTPVIGDARSRFVTAFYASYSIDRIVGAANMFDLLPEDRVPKKREANAETKAAVEQCRMIFKALPEGFAKESVLSSLGRVGTASLRDKVIHRANILIAASGDRFKEINLPCSQAVLCRNHYVHGSEAVFDYHEEFNAFAFLTETLEFVFAASDLIDLGWDFKAWRNKGTSMTHAFGAYVVNYEENLRQLKALVAQKK